jgi:maltooligosyltrehalose trehalohydrolase
MPPALFMGEEFAAAQPFLYFCDFNPDLVKNIASTGASPLPISRGFARPGRGRAFQTPRSRPLFSAANWTGTA